MQAVSYVRKEVWRIQQKQPLQGTMQVTMEATGKSVAQDVEQCSPEGWDQPASTRITRLELGHGKGQIYKFI